MVVWTMPPGNLRKPDAVPNLAAYPYVMACVARTMWPRRRRTPNVNRSVKASDPSTTYRRGVGVDEVIPGKQRSLVNFHSFRRWFITKAEQADQPESIIAVVVGHKRRGMTLGRYSAGPLIEQAWRCVEEVSLPSHPK